MCVYAYRTLGLHRHGGRDQRGQASAGRKRGAGLRWFVRDLVAEFDDEQRWIQYSLKALDALVAPEVLDLDVRGTRRQSSGARCCCARNLGDSI